MSLYFHVLHEHFPKIALFFNLSLLAACKFLQSTCHPLACLIIFYLVMDFFLHGWIFRSFYFSECSNLCLGSTWNIILNLYSQNEGNSFSLNVLNMLGKMLKAEKSFLIRDEVVVYSLSHIRLFATPWTVAHQAPLSMGFPRQDWSGLPFPSPGDLSDPRVKPASSALQVGSLLLSHQGSPEMIRLINKGDLDCE